jgi:hypothetical protein
MRKACAPRLLRGGPGAMIGWINLSVEAFIRESFGDDVWVALVAKARAAENRRGSAAPPRVAHGAARRLACAARAAAAPHWVPGNAWRHGARRAAAAQCGGLRAVGMRASALAPGR